MVGSGAGLWSQSRPRHPEARPRPAQPQPHRDLGPAELPSSRHLRRGVCRVSAERGTVPKWNKGWGEQGHNVGLSPSPMLEAAVTCYRLLS